MQNELVGHRCVQNTRMAEKADVQEVTKVRSQNAVVSSFAVEGASNADGILKYNVIIVSDRQGCFGYQYKKADI